MSPQLEAWVTVAVWVTCNSSVISPMNKKVSLDELSMGCTHSSSNSRGSCHTNGRCLGYGGRLETRRINSHDDGLGHAFCGRGVNSLGGADNARHGRIISACAGNIGRCGGDVSGTKGRLHIS